MMISTYICYNDEINFGRLNAVIEQDEYFSPMETEEDSISEENKDKVKSFLDLDELNY